MPWVGSCVSQNAFSAPQKQPRPNSAISLPSGYGPFSGAPFTKWVLAVGMGWARPGSASFGSGMAALVLKKIIGNLPVGAFAASYLAARAQEKNSPASNSA